MSHAQFAFRRLDAGPAGPYPRLLAVNQAAMAGRMQVHTTSMGMMTMVFSPRHLSDDYLSRNHDAVAASDPDSRRELADARRNGFATFDTLIGIETTGATVPVLDRRGTEVEALSVVPPRNSELLRPAVMALRTAAHGITRNLGEASSRPVGKDRPEIKDALLQSTIYCPVPAANIAFKIGQWVLAEYR